MSWREANPRACQVFLWRHGRTAWVNEGRFQGHCDPGLDEVGAAQAEAAARRLAQLRPAILVTSDLSRARQTVAPLERRVGISASLDPRLREISAGSWEGLTREEVSERFQVDYRRWVESVDYARGGGETMIEVGRRGNSALKELRASLSEGETAVFVTHGGTIRSMLGTALRLPVDRWRDLETVGHGRWSSLVSNAEGWTLGQHNVDRLPAAAPGEWDAP